MTGKRAWRKGWLVSLCGHPNCRRTATVFNRIGGRNKKTGFYKIACRCNRHAPKGRVI